MRIARMWRRLIEALRSSWAGLRQQFAEALRAMRTRLRSETTSDRVQHWLYQVSVEVVGATASAALVWMLTRGR